jgi:hypothetical protein
MGYEGLKVGKVRKSSLLPLKVATLTCHLGSLTPKVPYGAMVAHATLVCCRYLMLEIGKRTTTDPRTLGTLFHATCDEIRQSSFTEALAILLKLLEQTLKDVVGFSKEQVEHLVQQFLEQLPPVFRGRLLHLASVNDKNY